MTGEQLMQDRYDQISAYLDGTLSDAANLAFEADMERDLALADAVMRWQSNDSALKNAYNAPMHEPISSEMLIRLGLADQVPASNIIDFRAAQNARVEKGRARNLVAQWRWLVAGSLAASLVAAVMFQTQLSDDAPFDIKTSKSFQVAMQETASLARSKVENGQDVSPTLSFVDGTGRYCREFALAGKTTQQRGIACRANKKWRIEAVVNGDNALPAGSAIQTAAGADGKSLDSVYDRLGASDPLGANEEKTMIIMGWKK
jgi:hypothetical protein